MSTRLPMIAPSSSTPASSEIENAMEVDDAENERVERAEVELLEATESRGERVEGDVALVEDNRLFEEAVDMDKMDAREMRGEECE
ncbi:hypothetical protein PC9H_000419 [Pleurotus ostreatus]|uniref:Uncharacterized protein n=1 Tax=Pleurotus ostreatus TaxID=5322 RepID=A0A8H7DZC1_PLEOS|nr:uncharacterized protein PC9H_000419 [Pleurotus ostreatus]KAF7440076.1 hypothetical protein PC9H_000419 [Pleurotus ostreatus]